MISRRNIRVKVMQTLYSITSFEQEDLQLERLAKRVLDEKLDHVLDVFTVCVLYPLRVAEYSITDAAIRAGRYLKTAEDLNVNVRIATNPYVTKILQRPTLIEKLKKDKTDKYINEDWVKKLYQKLIKSDEYIQYIALETTTPAQDKEIIQFIWEKLMMENEDLLSVFIDDLPGWEDNRELIEMLMQNFYKNNTKVDFQKLLSLEKKEYAHDLLIAVLQKEAYCTEIIEPKLNNWDKERVALIDLILLKMGVCEFLFFPTIPTKVTINEYIDIAKQYSLPQSGQFVNGVLDNILKDLSKEQKINKEERNK